MRVVAWRSGAEGCGGRDETGDYQILNSGRTREDVHFLDTTENLAYRLTSRQ